MLNKRTTFTTVTPLPRDVSREVVMRFFHDHMDMIDLNPLVSSRQRIEPPADADADERSCAWYSLTDKVSYIPGGRMNNSVKYTCAFHDLPRGVQTHCRAPMGVDIKGLWTLCGTLPHEPPEPVELGIHAPNCGLYIREDVSMRTNVLMASFIKKTLQASHATLVERLIAKARLPCSRAEYPDGLSDCGMSTLQESIHQGSWTPSTARSSRAWGDSASIHTANDRWQTALDTPSYHRRVVSEANKDDTVYTRPAIGQRQQSVVSLSHSSTHSDTTESSGSQPRSPSTPVTLEALPLPLRLDGSHDDSSKAVDESHRQSFYPALNPYIIEEEELMMDLTPPPIREKSALRVLTDYGRRGPEQLPVKAAGCEEGEVNGVVVIAPMSATLSGPWSPETDDGFGFY